MNVSVRTLACCAAAVGSALVLALSLWASGTTAWEMTSYNDFVKGRFEGISLSREGRLSLAPKIETVFTSDQPVIWSVAQAIEFYGPVRETLRTKLKDVVAAKAKAAIEKELGLNIGTEQEQKLGDILGPIFGDNQFDNIVRFMSGRSPSECLPAEVNSPGSEKGIALVYEGVEAVRKIRDVLGPTDPSKAPPGSIRREFGQTIMINAAHASDSEDNAKREMDIINIGENNFRKVVEEFYGEV